jgi:uncharacterized membrane protein HdeD (DUF308 family)
MTDDTPPEIAARKPYPGWLRSLEIIAGIILVFLSFLVWGYPLIAGLTTVIIFGLALVVLGTMKMGQGIYEKTLGGGMRAFLIILGILLVGIGLYAIAFPIGGALTLIFFFAFALMLAGIDRLVLAGSGWPGPGTPRWVSYFSLIAGIFAVVVGFVALLSPGFGAVLLFVIISIAVLILGLELIVAGIRGRKIAPS